MAANNQDSHYSPVVVAAISFWLALVIVIILVYVCASCRRTRRSNTSTSINNSTQLATSFRMNGLENSILESLPIFIYTKEADLEEGSLDCTVCLSEFAVGDKGRRLPCGHDFHLDCIDLWFASHSSCPICRTSVTCKDACAESETECECDRLPQIGSNRAPQSFMLHLQDLPTSSGSESFKVEASPQIVRDLKRFLGSGRRMASLSNVQC